MNILIKNQFYMPAYYSIWRILKIQKQFTILLAFSYLLIKTSHREEVPYEDWLKSYILFSKALYLDNKLDDSLEILRGLLDIFPNIPLDEIKYLPEIHNQNKNYLKNNFFDFESAVKFYSKYHVYNKCEGIFKTFNNKTKKILSKNYKIDVFSEKTLENNKDISERHSRSLVEDYYIFENTNSEIYEQNDMPNFFNEENSEKINENKEEGIIIYFFTIFYRRIWI